MWSLHCLLLVVHRRRSTHSVLSVRIRIAVVRRLVAVHAMVRRLPSHAGHVGAIVSAPWLLLTISGRRLQDLRWVVTRRRVGRERGPLSLSVDGQRILHGRLRSRRRLHVCPHVSWHSSHVAIHGQIVVGALPVKRSWQTINSHSWRSRRRPIRKLRHRRLAISRVVFVIRPSRALVGHRRS